MRTNRSYRFQVARIGRINKFTYAQLYFLSLIIMCIYFSYSYVCDKKKLVVHQKMLVDNLQISRSTNSGSSEQQQC